MLLRVISGYQNQHATRHFQFIFVVQLISGNL